MNRQQSKSKRNLRGVKLLLVVDAAAREGRAESVILEAIEAALASAAKQRYEQDVLVRVSIDPGRQLRDLPAAGKSSPDDVKHGIRRTARSA